MKNEIIDKLKDAGYITVTDDSQGIADKVGISGEDNITVESLTKEEYDALEEKDPETIYIVKNDPTNGHEWVDIGQVDDDGYHIVWATKNIGAENPWDAGKYFAWGDTVGYYANEGHEFNWANCPYCNGDEEDPQFSKYNDEDGLTELQPEDDAAHVQWNGLWQIPNIVYLQKIIEDLGYPICYQSHENSVYALYQVNNINLIIPFAGFNNAEAFNDELDITSNDLDEDGNFQYLYAAQSDFEISEMSTDMTGRSAGMPIRPIIKVKDLSELDPTYDIYLGESKIVDNSTEDSNMTNILWEDLVKLRDNSKLIPGRYYRITDYNTTTVKQDTAAAGNQFDIIVLATDVNKLSEDAKAIMHDNTYDVTFRDGITKRCYFYPTVFDLTDINIVDCDTLLGISGVTIGEYEIDDINKKIILNSYDSDVLEEEGLQYNYFQYCNLEAWEIKYCLDNDIDRFDWAANYTNSQYGKGICVESDGYESQWYYIRYEIGDTNNLYAWAYINDELTSLSEIGTVEPDIDQADILYTKSENPKPGDLAYFGINRQEGVRILQTSVGTGVIYHMKDEFNNSAPYDFKNILSNITLAFLESIATDYFIPTDWLNAAYGDLPHDGDYYYYLFSYINLKLNPKASRFKEDASVKAYGFEDKYIICNNTVDNSIYDTDSIKGDKKIRLTIKNVFISNSNDVSKIDATRIINNHICANTEVCLFGPDCRYNFIGEDSKYIVMCVNSSHNTIMENCSSIELNLAVKNSLIKYNCDNIWLYGDSEDIEIGAICENLKIDDNCQDIKIGDNSLNLEIGDSCEHIKIGSSCEEIVIPTLTEYLIIEDRVTELSFEDRSGLMRYCNLTFLSGFTDYTVPALFQHSSFYRTNYVFGVRSDGTVVNGSLADLLNT